MEHSSKWNTHQNGTLIKMEHIKMEHSLNRNIHIKMEHSSKWNTHQNGTLIKMEHSSKWNTHQNGTLIKMEHIKMELIK